MRTPLHLALLLVVTVATAKGEPTAPPKSPEQAHAEWLKGKAQVDRELKESEAQLQELCNQLLPKLSEAQATAFKQAQIRWTEFREIEAVFRAHDYGGGQAESSEAFRSLVTAFKYYITSERVKSLQPTLAVH